MSEEIVNRVAQSKLVTFNLEDIYTPGIRKEIDITQWLYEGIVLKEAAFRQAVKEHSWEDYKDAFVAVYCSTEAIVPAWAFMLISSHLQPYASYVVVGTPDALETALYQRALENVDINDFQDKSVIIKGCSSKPVPLNAYIWATVKLQGVARSIMYGEACSAVPLFKRK